MLILSEVLFLIQTCVVCFQGFMVIFVRKFSFQINMTKYKANDFSI